MKFDFTGKTVLTTGAASGMSLLAAKNFLELGANVCMIDINEQGLQEEAAKLEAVYPGKVLPVICDVRDYQAVEATVKKAFDQFGSVDVMINLAGGAETRMLHVQGGLEFPDIPIDVFDWSLDVNLRGQFYFDHVVMRYMRDQKSGVIINIGSIKGEEGSFSNIAYSTSKSGAMNGLTKSLALYGAKYGVRAVCVSPGPVMTRPGMASMPTALGRGGDPQELVNTMIFLASENSSFTTGVNILVDGGKSVLDRRG